MVVQLAGGNFLPPSNLMAFTHVSSYCSTIWHPVEAAKRGPNDSNKQAADPGCLAGQLACDRKTELGKSFSHSCPFSVPLTGFCASQVRLLNKGYCVLHGVLGDFENSGFCPQSASQSQSWLSNSLLPMQTNFLHFFNLLISFSALVHQSHPCL